MRHSNICSGREHAKQIGDDMNDIKSYLVKTAYENEEVRGVFLPLLSLKTASEEELVSRTIRLAHEYPALREYILPFFGVELFKEAGSKGNKGKKKQQRKQKKQMKNRQRENAVKKEKNKSRNPMGVAPVNQSAFERAMARERGRLQGGTQKDYAFSTIWGYAMDETAELHKSAVKVMKGWVEKWNQSEAKKKLAEGAKKAGEMATQALEDSKVVKEVAGALLEEAGNAGMALSQRLAESAEGDFKQAKQNYMIAEEELGKRFGKEAGKYIGEVKKTLKETLEKEDSVQGNVEYKGRESQLSEGLALVKEGLMGCARKHLAKSSAEVKIKGAVRGAKTKTTAGAVAKAAPRGLFGLVKGIGSALGTTISMGAQSAGSAMQSKDGIDFGLGKTAADHEEAKQAVIKYLSLVEAEDIEYVQKFIDEDGVFDVDALKADLDKKNADFEKALLADLEASTKKVEEEAEKQDKEVEKKEVRIIERELGEDAFVAKTAVLKLAYDNPKYRPQLLQLLQVPRSHFAVAEIRDLLQRG